MKFLKLSILSSSLFIAACSTVEAIPGSNLVRTLTHENISHCKYIGSVRSFKDSFHEGLQGALKDSKNQAVRLGGNTVVYTEKISNRNFTELFADVYDCPSVLSKGL